MNPSWLPPATTVFVSFLLAAVSTPLLARALDGPGWRDLPRPDRHARRAVSRAGGAAWLLGLGGGLLAGAPDRPYSWVVATVAACAFALGRRDDQGRLRPGTKWTLQTALLAAAIALGATAARAPEGMGEGAAGAMAASFPGAARVAAAALVALGVQTALQVFDNLDAALGLVAGAAFLVFGLDPAAGATSPAALAAAGGVAGVLLWNAPPARVYFGNCGSLPIATLLALGVFSAISRPPGSGGGLERGARALLLLPLAWPLGDLAFVVAARLRRGVRPWTGGRDHTTHRLARALRSDRAAAAVIFLYAAATAGLALAGRLGPR